MHDYLIHADYLFSCVSRGYPTVLYFGMRLIPCTLTLTHTRVLITTSIWTTCTVEPPNNGHIGTFQLSLVERLSSSRRSIYIRKCPIDAFLCVHYRRLSLSQSVLYRRFHCSLTPPPPPPMIAFLPCSARPRKAGGA